MSQHQLVVRRRRRELRQRKGVHAGRGRLRVVGVSHKAQMRILRECGFNV